jgi:MOSC domain-containing protein YiiM
VHETPPRARLDVDEGLEGDHWARGTRDREAQITLMHRAVVELISADGQPPHLPGDNLLVDIDLSVAALPVGTRVRVGGALLEVSPKPHAGCKKFAERFGQEALRWINWHEHRDRRLRGVNCRILEGGWVKLGDPVESAGS